MRFTVCESTTPPVKALLQQHFILWYCDVNSSHEHRPYASGLSSYTLPLVCVISMADSDNYLDRTTSRRYANVFYDRLKSHIGDIDHSVSITLKDVILTLQVLTNYQTVSTVYNDGDIDGDARIGLQEAIYLLDEISSQ